MALNNKSLLAKAALVLLLACVAVHFVVADDDDSPCSKGAAVDPSPDWVNYGGFLFLIVLVIQMFWALALVCEEFFVPALNVLCEELKVPDDVAGATFMAAGASSPELFTSFIGLLIYNSNIGVGTVVGSEIFNHMIISAGSVLFAAKGTLYLDARIIMRDLITYAVCLLFLIWALKDSVINSLPHAFDTSQWQQCLDVTLAHGGVLVLLYACYATVAGNFKRLTRMFCPRAELEEETAADTEAQQQPEEEQEPSDRRSSLLVAPYAPRASFRDGPLYTWDTNEERATPGENHERPSLMGDKLMHGRRSSIDRGSMTHRMSGMRRTSEINRELRRDTDMSAAVRPTGDGIELKPVTNPLAGAAAAAVDVEHGGAAASKPAPVLQPAVPTTPKTTVVPGYPSPAYYNFLDIIGFAPPKELGTVQVADTVLKFYMSIYSDVIKLDALPELFMWHLRYFTIDRFGLHSISHIDEDVTGPHVEIVDLTLAKNIAVTDKSTFEFKIEFAEDAPTILFRCPNGEIMDMVIERLEKRIKDITLMDPLAKEVLLSDAQDYMWTEVLGKHEHSLLDVPRGRYSQIWYYMCFPLLIMFHYTLLDVREGENRPKYGMVIAVCVTYLALLSYIMILCCNYLGDFIGTTPTVMGLTLSAVGTSFPNLWSSMVVARQGFGSMAIGNALGSNIFNINMALGLPWFTYVLIHGGKAYREMKDHGIVMFIVLLQFVNLIWFLMIAGAGFRMYAWMAWVFVVIYFVVLITAVALS